jgi:uncharacterized membrane protein
LVFLIEWIPKYAWKIERKNKKNEKRIGAEVNKEKKQTQTKKYTQIK